MFRAPYLHVTYVRCAGLSDFVDGLSAATTAGLRGSLQKVCYSCLSQVRTEAREAKSRKPRKVSNTYRKTQKVEKTRQVYRKNRNVEKREKHRQVQEKPKSRKARQV